MRQVNGSLSPQEAAATHSPWYKEATLSEKSSNIFVPKCFFLFLREFQ